MPSVKLAECRHTIISSAAGGVLAIAAAPTGLSPAQPLWKSRIFRIVIWNLGIATLTFQDTGGTGILAPLTMAAALTVPFVLDTPTNLEALAETGIGLGLQANMSAAVQLNADVYWLQGP